MNSFYYIISLFCRLFLTPNRLFSEVYRRADQLGHMLSHAESHPIFASNMVQMLSQWMVWFPSDFQDESMLNKVRQMVKLIVQWHPESESKLNKLLQTLMTHLTAIEKHEKLLEKFKNNSNSSSVKNARNCQIQDLLHMEYTATDFAQV